MAEESSGGKPADFFVGLVDFFAILLPGAILTFWLYRCLEWDGALRCMLPPPPEGFIQVALYAVVAYVLGHLIYVIGSLCLDPLYDWWKESLQPESLKKLRDKANAVGKWRGVDSLEGMGVVVRLGSAGATSEMERPTIIQDGSGSGSGIPFKVMVSYTGNGSVHTYQDYFSGANDRASTLNYDTFGRLSTASDNVLGTAYSYSYDEFGNRWQQHLTAGTGYEADLTFNGNNRITTAGFSYDAAGNLLRDGSGCNPCWSYDDGGNVVSSSRGSSAATYSYDALGRRVEKILGATTFDFVLDGNNPIDEYQGSVRSRVNGGLFTYANGTTYFNRTDNIGTPRVSTDYTGAVKRTETMGPFGDGFTESYAGLDFTGFAGGVWDQENNGDPLRGKRICQDPRPLA
jgi:YD repeat-containing protein